MLKNKIDRHCEEAASRRGGFQGGRRGNLCVRGFEISLLVTEFD
jgi:hypothetical protein